MTAKNIIVSGFLRGAFYALLAVGFSIIFGVARMFKLSLGGYFVLGAYIALWLSFALNVSGNNVKKLPLNSWDALFYKIMIYTPMAIFLACSIFLFFRFRKPHAISIVGVSFVLFYLQRILLVNNYKTFNETATTHAFMIQSSAYLIIFALDYLELSKKQIYNSYGIYNITLILLNLTSNPLRSPALYMAILVYTIIIVAGLSMLVDRYLLEQVRSNPTNVLIVTFGIALLIQSMLPIIKYPEEGSFKEFGIITYNLNGIIPKTETFVLFGSTVQTLRVIAAIFAIFFITIVYLFIQYTPMGRAMKAVSQDEDAAWLVGINVRKVYLVATGLGMGLTAAAAVLTTPFESKPFFSVFMGWTPLILAIAVVTLGGVGSIVGSAIAGFLLGYTEVTISSKDISLSAVTPLLMIFVIMLIRPEGLFGTKEEDE